MDGSILQIVELTDVRVYTLSRINGQPAGDLVLVGAEEGGFLVEVGTGQFRAVTGAGRYEIAEKVVSRSGRCAVILGLGAQPDGPGVVPGATTVESHGKTYRIVFALETLCLASIETGPEVR